MTVDPTAINPPDDTGSDTFKRFCYQAHIAFPFCLDCALGGDVISVVAEHIEDIAVEYVGHWRFIQIKTRDMERGPWRLSDLLAEDGGLRTLLRSYRVLANAPATLELFLEGVVAPKDDICQLLTVEGRQNGDLLERVRKRLDLSHEECASFLARVRVVPNQKHREDIRNHNIVRLLGSQAPNLPQKALADICDSVVAKTHSAMASELLDDQWPTAVFSPMTASESAKNTVAAKRLTRDHLGPLVTAIKNTTQPLLKRFVQPDMGQPSMLEEKLVAGGAPSQIIKNAMELRANATLIEAERAAADLFTDYDAVLEDVRQRLKIRANAFEAMYSSGTQPAIQIWNELLRQLPNVASTLDKNCFFHRDPDLLLGELCQLADLCETSWGIANA